MEGIGEEWGGKLSTEGSISLPRVLQPPCKGSDIGQVW